MLVDLQVHWHQERSDDNDENDGFVFGIYTFEVPEDEIDTDHMFNNEVVNVEWFKEESERDSNYKEKPYSE